MSRTSLLIIEDIYDDPDETRREALASEFHQPHPDYPWFVSSHSSASAAIALKRISETLGEPLYDADDFGAKSSIGRFSCGLEPATALISVHSDPFMWAAVAYLHPNPPANSGTSFFRHRSSGRARREPDPERRDLRATNPLNVSYDLEDFEEILTVPNAYNRLILYDATQFHAAQSFFGHDLETGRLTQAFFFNLGRSYRP